MPSLKRKRLLIDSENKQPPESRVAAAVIQNMNGRTFIINHICIINSYIKLPC